MSGTPGGGPLAEVRVVDLSTVVAGPWATHILAQYGADVVKVEPPEGDVMRHAGPARHPGMGSLFLAMNANKRSVVLDLKLAAARDALLRICARADVVVTNVRAAAAGRLGIRYEDLAAVKEDLVYASLVGYDQAGPYADKPAYDDLIQGASGIAAIVAQVDGDQPRYVPVLVADRLAGMALANAVVTALFARERTGRGAVVEVPMFETLVEFVLSDHAGGYVFEPPLAPFGYNRILAPNRRPFATTDGYVCVLLYTERHWERFFTLVGQGDRFRDDGRLSDPSARRANFDAAYAIVAEIIATRTTATWIASLSDADIPVMPLNTVADLMEDRHLAATGFFRSERHPSEGAIRTVRRPARWRDAPAQPERPAPRLGEHTGEVLREAGLREEEIARTTVSA